MPRCVICDHCSEINGGHRIYTLNEEHNYECSVCRKEIRDDVFDYYPHEGSEDWELIRPGWDSIELERPTILGKRSLETDKDLS